MVRQAHHERVLLLFRSFRASICDICESRNAIIGRHYGNSSQNRALQIF